LLNVLDESDLSEICQFLEPEGKQMHPHAETFIQNYLQQNCEIINGTVAYDKYKKRFEKKPTRPGAQDGLTGRLDSKKSFVNRKTRTQQSFSLGDGRTALDAVSSNFNQTPYSDHIGTTPNLDDLPFEFQFPRFANFFGTSKNLQSTTPRTTEPTYPGT